jgi:hypothetical protein
MGFERESSNLGQHCQGNQVVVLGTLEHLKMCNESEHRQSHRRGVPLENALLPWRFLIEL